MKKFLVLTALLGLAASAGAQTKTQTPAPAPKPAPSAWSPPKELPLGVNAIGYDVTLGHVTARIGLAENNSVDVGVGLDINTARASDVAQFGVSGFYLLKLQDWGVVDNYAIAGGWLSQGTELGITGFAGLQPEITFLERFIVSFRFGLQVPVIPDFAILTRGNAVSLVEGANFKVIW